MGRSGFTEAICQLVREKTVLKVPMTRNFTQGRPGFLGIRYSGAF